MPIIRNHGFTCRASRVVGKDPLYAYDPESQMPPPRRCIIRIIAWQTGIP